MKKQAKLSQKGQFRGPKALSKTIIPLYEDNQSDSDTVLQEQCKPDGKKESKWRQEERKAKSRSEEVYVVQKMIKTRIFEKVADLGNKTLYPELMGPHRIYAVDQPSKANRNQYVVNLKEKLREWMARLLGGLEQLKERIEGYQKGTVIDEKGNRKYNKYTLEFKMGIVKKINEQIASEGQNAKSLRFYIVREANLLNIHPKNITRWFETKDLDKRQGGRLAKYPFLEYKLAKFIYQNPYCKRKTVMEEAKRILSETGEDKDFNFSKGWYERFKIRLKQNKVQRSIENILDCSNQSIKNISLSKSLAQFFANDNDECKIENVIFQEQAVQDEPTVKIQSQ